MIGRRAEVSLYRLFKVEGTHRYVRIVKKGRGWIRKTKTKTKTVGQPGAYDLRYQKNGRRTYESVGGDPQSQKTTDGVGAARVSRRSSSFE